MSQPDPRIAALEAHFREVEVTRMGDVPILNPALQVEAVGFQPIEAGWLGVLVSPWFMNLVWLRSVEEGVAALDSLLLELPSGEYEFFPNHAPDVGTFYTCSLFSPVLQFEDQAAAVLTAQHVMQTLLVVPPPAPISRRDFLRGRVGQA
jgi:[NiFe] hydrogenase assembly HybE family chaperone